MGTEVDKWSPAHLAKHYDAFVGELCCRIPAADRKSWRKVIVADSYEKGGQNWRRFLRGVRSPLRLRRASLLVVVFSGLTAGAGP